MLIPSITYFKCIWLVLISNCEIRVFSSKSFKIRGWEWYVLKSMEELIIKYLSCVRPCARHLVFLIQFNYLEQFYEVGRVICFFLFLLFPFFFYRWGNWDLRKSMYLPKFMGFKTHELISEAFLYSTPQPELALS